MKMTWQYIAGFFDGEGCICLRDYHKNKTYVDKNKNVKVYPIYDRGVRVILAQRTRIYILLAQKENGALKSIGDFIGKKGIKFGIHYSNKAKTSQNMEMGEHKSVEKFLSNIYPYLIVKKEKAKITLDYIKNKKWYKKQN